MARMTQLLNLNAEMRRCRRCMGAGYPTAPGAVFSGTLGARVMVIGQAPGATESASGFPFCGPAGHRLFRWLAEVGWQEEAFRATHYITAVTKCFPGKGAGGRGDRAPSRVERELCAPFLARELELIAPGVVLAVGGTAIRHLLGPAPLGDRVGERFLADGRIVVPLPHPSGANLWLNRPESRDLLRRALDNLRELREAEGI
jgi:uracil-DNA glycosylase